MKIKGEIFNSMSVWYDVGFAKDTAWGGDSTEIAEAVFCDKSWLVNDILDCYAMSVKDPKNGTTIESKVWHTKAAAAWKDLTDGSTIAD